MTSWQITHCSENAAVMLLGDASGMLLGESIETVLSPGVVHDIRNTLQSSMVSGSAETLADVTIGPSGRCDLMVHMSEASAVIEVLPKVGGVFGETTAPTALLRSMLNRLKRAPTLERAFVTSVNQLRAVTGFDRVMIYKFLEDGSGQVLAEALRSGMPPFLGLHYPASDIPAQARDLYLRQPMRLIPDVSYRAASLRSHADAEGDRPLDLGLATLRGVSPVHLEYLRNMGSAATMTISLLSGGRLWGLIACHHEVPRRLAPSICSACELFGQVFSLQIEAQEQARELGYITQSHEAHDRLIAGMPPEETLFDNLSRYSDLLMDLIPCDGIGIWTSGVFSGMGILPPVEDMTDLIAFLARKDGQKVFATDALDQAFPAARSYRQKASGLLAIPFSRAPRDYLIFFRREILQIVNWGGDPHKPVEPSPDGGRVGLRKSFAAWREEVSGRSKPWHPSEVKIAEALRVSLLDVIMRRSDLVERERRAAQESQALLVAELNHRVKNILALIRSLVRQSRHGAESIAAFTIDLEHRLRALAHAHDQSTQSGWTWAPLHRLLDAEAEVWTRSRRGLTFEGPNALLDPRAYQTLALVFHELMTNAAKYGALSTAQGTLAVRWQFDDLGRLEVTWAEQGGPAVHAPSRRGFGSVVVEQTVPFELNGEARVEYRLEGAWARFVIPPTHAKLGEWVRQDDDNAGARAEAAPFRGKRLLLVEDSMMIALDAQAALQDAGLQVDISGSTTDAMRALNAELFDGAVLDINLSGETSFGVADSCVARRLPFIFATGYGESVIMPDRFKGVPVVSKPYDEPALQVALAQAASQASDAS